MEVRPVLLDHLTVLGNPSNPESTYTTANLDLDYPATSSTHFVDHKGDVIAVGTSDLARTSVINYISEKSHEEDGVLVGNYLYAGEPYTFRYGFSEQVFSPADGDSTSLARYQLRGLTLNYSDTGSFRVSVEAKGRDKKESLFTGRILGDLDNVLGYSSVVDSGSHKVGILSQAKDVTIEITNDSHLPCSFQSAEYEGFVTLRSQRI